MYLKDLLQEEEEKQNAVFYAKKLLNADELEENRIYLGDAKFDMMTSAY